MIEQLSLFDTKETRNKKRLFKDKCDLCHKFDYLKSYDKKCLCCECLKKIKIK